MKQKKIIMNYKPLSLSMSMDVVGSVAGKQSYSADLNTYTPDYTITPLVLMPRCIAVDQDGLIQQKLINASLTNVKWEQVINNVSTIITEYNTSYEVAQTGDTKGQLKIKVNAPVNTPVTYRFYAEFVDKRTNQIFKYFDTYLLKCVNASEVIPILSIDSGVTVLYDPILDPLQQTIKAVLKIGELSVANNNRRFFWYIRDTSGNLVDFDNSILGFNSKVDDTIVVDRELMGSKITIVCRASYSPTGVTPPNPDLSIAESTTTIVRRFPAFDYDIYNLPDNISVKTSVVNPKVVVKTTNGIIQNPFKWLSAKWYTQKNASSQDWSAVANGENPSISLSQMTTDGLNVAVEVTDRGALNPASDLANNIFTDSNGSILLIN